jgi:hypothetical protein
MSDTEIQKGNISFIKRLFEERIISRLIRIHNRGPALKCSIQCLQNDEDSYADGFCTVF